MHMPRDWPGFLSFVIFHYCSPELGGGEAATLEKGVLSGGVRISQAAT